MADEIDLTQINENFPIAGITQSSQGFRDNFRALKAGLGATKTTLSGIAVTLGGLSARITGVESVVVNLDDMISEAIVIKDLEARVDGLDLSLNAKITDVMRAYADADEALSQRISNLSASTSAGTLALINEETLARVTADSALASQITTMSATVAANTAGLSQEATIRANADSAMATRLIKLESTTVPQPNLVYNPTFVRGFDGWSAYRSAGADWSIVNAGIWGDYARSTQSIAVGQYNGHMTNWFKVQTGRPYTYALDVSNIGLTGGLVKFDVQWANDSNTVLGTTEAVPAIAGSGWTRYSGTTDAPAGATKARLRFYLDGATNTDTMVRRVKVEQGPSASGFSDEATLGVTISSLTALITQEQTTRTTQDEALAQLITNLTSTVTTNQQTNTAAITSEATTRTNADSALSTRIDTLTAKTVTDKNELNAAILQEQTTRTSAVESLASQISNISAGVSTNYNLLYNPTFNRSLEGWTPWRTDTGDWTTVQASADGDYATFAGNVAAAKYNGLESTKFKVNPSKKYAVGFDVNTQGLTSGVFQLQIVWYGASNNLLSSATPTEIPAGQDWAPYVHKATAPANAAFASVRFRMGNNVSAVTNTSTKIRRIKAEQGENSTSYSDDSTLGNIVLNTQALISSEATTRANADSALSLRVDSLTSTVSTNAANLAARIQTEETARADSDSALSQRIDTLTSTVTTNTSNLNSSITNEQQARTTQDNALALQISNLTTTVTNNNTSLSTRITDEASARATADGALGTRVTGVETRVAGVEGSMDSINARVETIETASSGSNEALAIRTTNLESQIRALGSTKPHPYAGWDFLDGNHGWTASAATIALSPGGGLAVTATGSNSNVSSGALAAEQRVIGAKYPLVVIEVQNTGSVTLTNHSLFYSTTGHTISGSHFAHPIGGSPTMAAGSRMVLVYDMRALTVGGQDWINSEITGLRYDASNNASASYKIWRVQILGFDGGVIERELKAQIKTEEETRVTQLEALAGRTDILESRINPSPNLLFNSTFSLGLDSWTMFGDSNNMTAWSPDASGVDGARVTSITVTGVGKTHGYMSQKMAIVGSNSYTLSADIRTVSLLNSKFKVDIEWYNGSNAVISRTGLIEVSTNIAWDRKTITVTSPSNAVTASVRIYVQDTTQAPVAIIKKIKFEGGVESTPWNDDATTGQSIGLLYSAIQSESLTRTTSDATLSTRIDSLNSTVTGNYGTLDSKITDESTTRTNAVNTLANRASVLESRINTNVNLLQNSTAADGLNKWTQGLNAGWVALKNPDYGWTFSKSYSSSTNTSLNSDKFPILATSKYTLSGFRNLTALSSGLAKIDIIFYNAGGTALNTSTNVITVGSGYFPPITMNPPAGATHASVLFGLSSAVAPAGSSFSLWKLKVEVGEVATPYGDDSQIYDLLGRISTINNTVADLETRKASAQSVTNLTSVVNANKSEFNDFVGTQTTENESLSTRITNLNTTFTGLNTTTNSRIDSEITTRSNADTALASRASTLEAQMSGTQGSALQTRISTEETARANAVQAIANRTTSLETEISGARNGSASLAARLTVIEQTTGNVDLSAISGRITQLEASMGVINSSRILEPTGSNFTRSSDGSSVLGSTYVGQDALGYYATHTAALTVLNKNADVVSSGKAYEVSITGQQTGGSSNHQLVYWFLNSSGTSISNGSRTVVTIPTGAFKLSATFGFSGTTADVAIPAGTVAMRYGIQMNVSSVNGTVKVREIRLAEVSNDPAIYTRLTTVENTTADLQANKASASSVTTLTSEVTNARNGKASLLAEIQSVRQTISDGLALKASSTDITTLNNEINLKPGTYVSGSAPSSSGRILGDLWMNSSNNNVISRWNGSSWVAVHDTRGQDALNELVAARGGQVSLSAKFTQVNQTIVDGLAGKASATSLTNLTSTVDGHTSSINSFQGAINGINATASLVANAGGKITGFKINSSAAESTFDVLASRFRIIDPNNANTAIVPFRVEGGNVYMNNAYINNLSVGQLSGGTYYGNMLIGGNKVQIDGSIGRILITD